jgi:hypothetical protein
MGPKPLGKTARCGKEAVEAVFTLSEGSPRMQPPKGGRRKMRVESGSEVEIHFLTTGDSYSVETSLSF